MFQWSLGFGVTWLYSNRFHQKEKKEAIQKADILFRSGGSLERTMSGHSWFLKSLSIQELHNMVQYPDIVKHSGIPNRSSEIA